RRPTRLPVYRVFVRHARLPSAAYEEVPGCCQAEFVCQPPPSLLWTLLAVRDRAASTAGCGSGTAIKRSAEYVRSQKPVCAGRVGLGRLCRSRLVSRLVQDRTANRRSRAPANPTADLPGASQ